MRIHIVYDPLDRVTMPDQGWLAKAQAKVAIIPVKPDQTELEFGAFVRAAVKLLLSQVQETVQ